MRALLFSEYPNYSGVIFRRTFKQLTDGKGIIPRSMEWMSGKGPIYNKSEAKWTFPAGGTLIFRHMEHETNRFDYQGAEFHFIGWDELTHLPTDSAYTYLLSRLRRIEGDPIPLQCCSTSNPGGVGHTWVKARFLDSQDPERAFIPARLSDNPTMNPAEYTATLSTLPPVEQRRLLNGDWSVSSGTMFPRRLVRVIARADLPSGLRWVRSWDTATSQAKRADQSAGIKAAFDAKSGILYLDAPRAGRWEGPDVLEEVVSTALLDGTSVEVCVEGVASQVNVVQHLQRDPRLLGHRIRRTAPIADKVASALPWSQRWKSGQVVLVDGYDWGPWVDQWADFTGDPKMKDDKVDCVSRAVEVLSKNGGGSSDAPILPMAPPPSRKVF
jgi:phage terminase large subunit-like protein